MESFRHLALGGSRTCSPSLTPIRPSHLSPQYSTPAPTAQQPVDISITARDTLTLRSLPAGQSRPSADFSAYSRELGLTASVEAVREVLRGAGIRAAVSWQDGRCVITPVDIRDRAAIETLLAVNAGDLPWCIAEGTP